MSTSRREPLRAWCSGCPASRTCDGAREHVRGFTLTEVLVSVAVLATLVSLLLPGLAGARESARAVGCSSNLRQIGVGLHTYAGDFRGRAAPAAAEFLRNLDRWHGVRERVADAFTPSAGSRVGPLSAYMGEDRPVAPGASLTSGALTARSCPTFVPTLDSLAAATRGFERSCGGYGYNGAFLGVQRSLRRGTTDTWDLVTDRTGSTLSRFRRPAATLAFADSAMVDPQRGPGGGGAGAGGVIEYSFIEPRFWPDSSQPRSDDARPDPSMHFRHGARAGKAGAAQAAYLDGHVAASSRSRTHSSGVYPTPSSDPLTGWSGDADDNSAFGYN